MRVYEHEMKHPYHILLLVTFVQLGICARILGFFTTPSFSHQQTFRALCKELALRGHYVTFISPEILNDSSIKNLKEIDIQQTYQLREKYDVRSFSSKNRFTLEQILAYFTLCGVPNEIAFNDETVQQLIRSEESFDLLIIQAVHPLTFAMASKFQVPVVGKRNFVFPS